MQNKRMTGHHAQTGFNPSVICRFTRRCWYGLMRVGVGVALIGLALLMAQPAQAAREVKEENKGAGDVEARRLLDKATEALTGGDNERGLKMIETVIEQYPASNVRYSAYLALGRHYVGSHEETKAIGYLNNLKALETAAGVVAPANREVFLEGMYLLSTAYFQIRNYAAAFPILRKITTGYPNTAWANQAYYYIGLCHFMQQNWSKAIEALSMVGTFVDVNDPETALVEAGRRLYIKVNDNDLTVLTKLGKRTWVEVDTTHGDRERVECLPLSADSTLQIGSIASEVGAPKTNNNVLEVYGGDEITVHYVDANTKSGAANVPRERKVKVVSTGGVKFTQGNYESPAAVAFLGQPIFLALFDADLDNSDAAESVTVKVISRYKEQAAEETVPGSGLDLKKVLEENTTKQYRTRDELNVQLNEIGAAPVHSGRFTGQIMTQEDTPDRPANTSDNVLSCAVDDEIVVTYTDELHLGGATPRVSQSNVRMAGQIDS
ncbi:MAG: tetratricopeptide repeat protein, partial [Magnetococcus sp. WYHC-3]